MAADGEALLRPAAPRDVPSIRALDVELFPVRYSDRFYDALFSDVPGVALVAAAGRDGGPDAIVGVATGRMVESGSGLCAGRRVGYLATLGVTEAWRGRGLGPRLLREAIRGLKEEHGAEAIELHVAVENEAAVRMYKREGFRAVEMLADHYTYGGGTHDALRMVLPLGRDSSGSCQVM